MRSERPRPRGRAGKAADRAAFGLRGRSVGSLVVDLLFVLPSATLALLVARDAVADPASAAACALLALAAGLPRVARLVVDEGSHAAASLQTQGSSLQ